GGRARRPHRGPDPRGRRAHPGRGLRALGRGRLRPLRLPPPVPAAARGAGGGRGVTPFNPTDEQREAIEHPLAPLLVVAGAGTGKTTVMAERILHLVKTGQAR